MTLKTDARKPDVDPHISESFEAFVIDFISSGVITVDDWVNILHNSSDMD